MERLRKLSIVLMLSLFLFSILLIIYPNNIKASDTITVGPDGPPAYDYTKISEAILYANESDIINVYGGTYSENIIINKSIKLISTTGSANTIIISPDENKNTIEITANSVTVSGFTVRNLGGSFASIKINSAQSCIISNNKIKNGGNGLYLIDTFSNTIDSNTFENNNVGIYFSNADGNTLNNNYVQNNNQNGIFVASTSTNNRFYQNHFSNNDGNAYDLGINNWDYNSLGNYWDDYNDYDSNGDGVGDNPYYIDGSSNVDHYPLGDFLSLNQKPVAYIDSISPNPAKYGDTITFTGHGSDDGSVVSWEWKSDGNIIGTSGSFSTSSLSPATHSISFRVEDDDGEWSDYVYQSITIGSNIRPTAHLLKPTKSTFNYGESIDFYGYGTDPDGNIDAYLWRSVPSEINIGEYSFKKSDLPVGDYIVYFKVRDNEGEWSLETSINIKILPDTSPENLAPIADAGGPYDGYTGEIIAFNSSKSYDPDQGDTLTYNWDFGDGEKGAGADPTHIYTTQGNYTIELTVTDLQGIESNSSTQVAIYLKTNSENGDNKEEKGIPGFELFIFIFATLFLATVSRYRKSRR